MTDPMARNRLSVTFVLGVVAAAAFTLGLMVTLVQYGSFERIWQDVVVRPSGPFGFRFIVQPIVAAVIAAIDGVNDAKAGRRRHFWRPHLDKGNRWDQLVGARSAEANVLFLAVVLDTAYQLAVTRTFYPFETILVALLLAVVPYLIVRAPAAWLASHFVRRRGQAGRERMTSTRDDRRALQRLPAGI